ncbi:hypothetical protein QQS21_008520 [Conoideocrella luteorostrata]|uniref:Uncharacterized protein n=1 Tax=Conoideocrella luteorostrata TaxID=1105319 RepID=A0AAJ0FVX5_9HYPO|nr:hypothetical protein QQS21_008520 [Conoideocrella luteorostrata]
MALMLAPYNEAMRLGMGFNSYTQQLCCNDVVRLPSGRPATEQDLQDTKQKPPRRQSIPSSGAESNILTTQKGSETIVQKKQIGVGNDSQNEVSQVVDWHASFIDTVSEVTKKLDISGALSVNVDAIGSVKVAGHYVDDKALKESDATYDITVNVTNQRLEAPQVTQFAPIDNIQPNRFNEVYGDCFISGFLEGGLFHAVVACKRVDDKALLDTGGEIDAGAKISGLDIKAKIKAEFKTGTTKQNYTTTITVNWSGGGDIKPDNVTDWDIKTLTRAAMEFPDKVAACPQKTYAILTKYTSLRTFHEATNVGSPLDYENAGIYTNSLLDAYMDYKYIWSQIQERISAVDKGLMIVHKAEEQAGLASYRDSFTDSFQKRMEKYEAAQKLALAKPNEYGDLVLEPPMPPNKLIAYAADLFGLDQAKQDCRFEMIKIVKEVNAVSLDPKVATDSSRLWQYVAPSIFERLVPYDKEAEKKVQAISDGIKKDMMKEVQNSAQGVRAEAGSSRESFYQSGQPTCDLEKRVNLRYGHLAEHWRIDSINGQSTTPSSALQFNDLDVLDKTYVVMNITVWHDEQRLVGIQLLYHNGQVLFHGVKGSSYQSASFNIDSSRRSNPERVNLVWLEAHADEAGSAWVDTIRVVTTGDLLIVEPSKRLKYNKSFELKATKPGSGSDWDLRGFYGSFDPTRNAFAQLSPIWGRAVADSPAPQAMPLFEPEAWNSVLSWPISAVDGLIDHLSKGDRYRLSHPRGSLTNTTGKPFNALDYIDESWVISSASFYFKDVGDISVLSGVAVDYSNNKQLQHGQCGAGMMVQTWEPAKKENERIVGVSTCFMDRKDQSQCSLGLRLFFEAEEEAEGQKKEEPANENKPTGISPVEDAESKQSAATATSDPPNTATRPAQPSGYPPKEKVKVVKKSELWLTGSLVHREHSLWDSEAASVSPSRSNPSQNWTIKGFMGQAGSDGIETIAVVWGKAS